ncbi:MAG: hypothetical protein Q8O16_07045 [Dehalococcoidia bacterium]|nr:hypothetical protein [Dehalococcoidia bacterium]
MKCSKCGREITQEQAYNYEGKTMCEDCMMEIGLHPKECEPWATYVATHTPGGAGPKSKQGLTDLQKQVHEFIKSKGKITREDVMERFKLSESEMDTQMTALYHSEMVKENREGNKVYLINIQ